MVAEYILSKWGGDAAILPSDPGALARAKLWAEMWGAYVGPAQVCG